MSFFDRDRANHWDSPEDDYDDSFDDDPDGMLDDEDDTTIPCPACGEAMFDDSPRCPHCGVYVVADGGSSSLPNWVVLTVLVCLALAAWWIIGSWL